MAPSPFQVPGCTWAGPNALFFFNNKSSLGYNSLKFGFAILNGIACYFGVDGYYGFLSSIEMSLNMLKILVLFPPPPTPGILRDHLGTYDVAFYLAGVPPLIGGAVLCFIPWVHEKKKPKGQARPVDGETSEKMLQIKNASLVDSVGKPSKGSESVI